MLSGNGRHRRPRQAPALVVAAGVTGSAIAIPLLAATSANAASTATWDKLAECESGGQWSLDAGNGYYGGLQFSQEMWERYGGLDFAPRADEASRSQQIAVAEKVLAAKGPTAWPSCSIVAGLTKGDESADVDPGVSASPKPSGSVGTGEKNHDGSDTTDTADTSDTSDTPDSASSSGSSGSSGSADSSDASDAPSSDASEGASSGDKGSGATGDKAEEKAGGGASGEVAGGADAGSGESGRSDSADSSDPADGADPSDLSGPSASPTASDDSLTGGRHRGDRAADETSASRAGEGRHASREADRAGGTYTVRSGDNLWDIADAHDVRGGWDALYDLNKKTVGTDPGLILPGQSLDLGLEPAEK
ncbi:transglycosylase family protein [Streptomyces sp. NPDC102406]|uniref:transglycosylase family protein n=1 Tax=Streptomyces sp. NPDC102406 TaxID=3366171 RepID=UPI00382B4B68